MKTLIRRLLKTMGLVTAGSYDAVVQRARAADGRVKKLTAVAEERRATEKQVAALTKQLEVSRNESREWKKKAEDLARQGETVDRELKRQAKEIESLIREIADAINAARKRDVDLGALQQRLTESDRELALAREHLMTIEVKLDILEGAANVLDSRMRATFTRRDNQVSSPV